MEKACKMNSEEQPKDRQWSEQILDAFILQCVKSEKIKDWNFLGPVIEQNLMQKIA